MEGSVATTGGTGTGTTGGEGGEGEGGGETAAPDFGALAQTLEGVQTSQHELREMFTDLASQFADTGETGDGEAETAAELDLGFLDGEEALDPAQLATRLQDLVDQRAQQLVDKRLGPLEQRVGDGERTRLLQELVDDIPDMGNPEVSRQVVQATDRMADAYGWPEELKQDPRMWRVVFLSAKAIEAAREEGDGSDAAAATLEGGGGARPAGGSQEVDLGNEIVQARKGRGALPFG